METISMATITAIVGAGVADLEGAYVRCANLGLHRGTRENAAVSGVSGSVDDGPVPAVFLERDAELALVADLVRDIAIGRGGLVLFEAPAGLGKSALTEHGARVARAAGLTVLRARGHQLEQAFSWGVTRTLFEGLLQGSPAVDRERFLDGPAAPARQVFEDVTAVDQRTVEAAFSIMHGLYWLTLRVAQRQPLLLVVDDAQWADEPSLRFLVYLAARISEAPIGALVALRPSEATVRGLIDVLAEDPATRARTLHPLGPAAVRRLVQQRLDGTGDEFCRRCYAATGGNPLLLRELLAAFDGRPGSLDDAWIDAGTAAARALERSVLRRLDTMTPQARALAVAVAVFEDDVRRDLAAALAAVEPAAAVAAVDELVRADLLRTGDPLGFVHPLVRAAVYGGLPDQVRAETHRTAARLLAESGESIEKVCAHLLEAPATGDEGVVDALRASARRALAQGAPASAVRYLERAQREPPSLGARPGVLAELGHAEATAGLPQALSHLEGAVALAVDAGERARLFLEFGRAQHHVGRLGAACTTFRRGLAELAQSGIDDTELGVELEGGYLNAAMFEPDHVTDAHRRAVGVLAGVDALSSNAELALLSKAVMMRLWAGARRDKVLAATRRLVAEGRLTADDAADSQVAWQAIATLGWCDDYAAADDAIRAAFADARRRGSVLSFALASIFRSRHGLWTGPLSDAVDDARSALGILPPDSVYVSSAGYCLVSGLVEQGQHAEAERVLALASAGLPPFFAAWWEMARGRLAVLVGDDEKAFEAYLAAGRHHHALQITNPAVLPWRSEAGLIARRLGRPERAAKLIGEELDSAERFGAPRAVGVARRAAGLLARGDTAVELLRSAVEVLAAAGARVEQARAMADLGAAIRRAGRPAEARRTLREAVLLSERLGASAVAGHARDELRAAGGRAPAGSGRAVDGLTPGERRVAELAANGQSNRQIANSLFITVKAVEWHLGNAYRKLGVRKREELSGALTRASHT
jgi:DNA-binding CsgD family transcriptional regulator